MAAKDQRPKTEDQNTIDWQNVTRVLVVKLRSIGDTVLSTPSLIALRRLLPDAQIDILLEDWVAPILDGFDAVDNVISVGKGSGERLKTAWNLRRGRYDVAFNLHGGTTATFFTAASRAKHRVGFADYQYSFLYNHLLSSASEYWGAEFTHSAEQQLALLGFVGVPVEDRPKTRLAVTADALESVERRLGADWLDKATIALIHPGSAFETKRWPLENYADLFENLAVASLAIVAVGSPAERQLLEKLQYESAIPVEILHDLSLPEITALASISKVFIGNDSGIAHIAAAVQTPSVVVFGSSNRNHWRPWTDAPHEIVFEEFPCQPCPGYRCEVFGTPKCIISVTPDAVFAAIESVLSSANS